VWAQVSRKSFRIAQIVTRGAGQSPRREKSREGIDRANLSRLCLKNSPVSHNLACIVGGNKEKEMIKKKKPLQHVTQKAGGRSKHRSVVSNDYAEIFS